MIRIGNATPKRFGTYDESQPVTRETGVLQGPLARPEDREISLARRIESLPRWLIRGYQEYSASDLAAAVAFNALIALVPMFFLIVSVAGLFFRDDAVLQNAVEAVSWLIPISNPQEIFEAAVEARSASGWLGALSLVAFAWIGTSFISAMARSMNRIYGVRNSGYVSEKRRGFVMVFFFALFFTVSSVAPVIATFLINQPVPDPVEDVVLSRFNLQIIGYVIGVVAALILFLVIYRVVPNAGQQLTDVIPGAVTAALLLSIVTQVFPLYISLVGGVNRYGAVLGLVWLLVISFYVLAHVILFGTYVNASWLRYRRRRDRRRLAAEIEIDNGADATST